MPTPQGPPSTIAAISSVEEAAAFWDSHDFGEFENELEPVEVEVPQPLAHIVSVQLDSEAFRRLGAVARERGVNLVRLAQTWVLDALDEADGGGSVAAERRAVGAGLPDRPTD